MRSVFPILIVIAPARTSAPSKAKVPGAAPAGRPSAVVDLATREGAALVSGHWRYADAKLIEVDHRAPGADLKPSGAPTRAYDITPHAGAANFSDAEWEMIDATSLDKRRSGGRLSFAWYRIRLTIPNKVGNFDPTGSTVVFEVVLDDYSEIWVDGQLPLELGQTGGGLVRGWNAPNRVIVGRDVKPGQEIQLAVFGANGTLSDPPGNFIWIRSATLDFYKDSSLGLTREVAGEIVRLDPAVDAIAPTDARVEKLAGGFQFTEGPIWHPDGYLLFSDPNANTIYRWTPDGQVSVFRTKSGYAGVDVAEYGQPGSNGITLDPDGRVTIDQHGNRRVIRIEKTGAVTVLADGH